METDCRFTWCEVGQRPPITATICRVAPGLWPRFAPYHYLSAAMTPCAQFALCVAGTPVAFAAVQNFPHPRRRDIRRVHRVVVLPDWQGLGIGPRLLDRLGAAYRAHGLELRIQTANSMFARQLARGDVWRITFRGISARTRAARGVIGHMGGRLVMGLAYRGEPDATAAAALLPAK